jgi:molybdopterin-guanine dinucleotide biosynthesis protein A
MVWRKPSDASGYVLAGGKSSRMGRDKALLELAGKPLALHAVVKLRRVCMDVHMLSDRPELDAFAPLVPDLHANCGPLGGVEAGLEYSARVYPARRWSLFMPVDMPFLPSAFLDQWVRAVIVRAREGQRIAMFTVDGRPQPALCLMHQEVLPYVSRAIQRGEFKLLPVLEEAGRDLAERQGETLERVFFNLPWNEDSKFSIRAGRGGLESWWRPTEAQQTARRLWFSNLNTPQEFIDAEQAAGVLDT